MCRILFVDVDMETSMDSYYGEPECYLRAIVVKKHDATDDSQLSLKVNEIVIILEQDETGWWGGHLEGKEMKTGWFPGSCVRITPSEKPDISLSSPARQTPVESKRLEADLAQKDVSDVKREKASLEEKLRSLERKNEEDQKTIGQLNQSLAKLEAQVHDLDGQLGAERRQKKHLQEEVAQLKGRLEVASGKLEKLESLSHPKSEKEHKEQRYAIEAAQAVQKQVSESSAVVTPVNTPVNTENLTDAPRSGCVKEIRDAFERASTPQRERGPASSSRNSYSTLPREVLPPSSSGRFSGPVESRDTDFGLSPIRRGSRPRPYGSDVGMHKSQFANTPVRC